MKISKDLYAFLWQDPSANNANTYFINSPKKILIDPGHDHLFGHVRDNLAGLSVTPEDIDLVVLTHGHPDHMEAVQVFSDSRALIALHPTEYEFITRLAPQYGAAMGVSGFEPHFLLQEGDLKIDDLLLHVIHTPGHSPGSICLYWPERRVLISGDVVFSEGLGRTDLPGGSGEALKQSIRDLSRLEVEHLLPGHGEPVSGRGRVKANFENIETMWFGYI